MDDISGLRTDCSEWPPRPSRVHLIGIGGAGMKALAEWAADAGYRVTGSDSSLNPVLRSHYAELGISTASRHDPQHVAEDVVLVIHSPAIGPDNPERMAAHERGIPVMSYPAAIGSIMRQGLGVSVAGTHGKSSTTGMIASILEAAGRDPSVVCGAEMIATGRNGMRGTGPIVVESCEYRRHFLQLAPRIGVVLNVEGDHFDCFPEPQHLLRAFQEFASQIPRDGVLVLNRDCSPAASLARHTSARVVWFSPTESATGWSASRVTSFAGETSFDLRHDGASMGAVSWQQAGRHQIGNAVAAAAVCDALDVPTDAIRAGLEAFRGMRRRLEVLGEYDGVTLIDDYAHHPTEVRATLEAVRQKYEGRRIWCAFQPHQLSRTRSLLPEFMAAFDNADEVLICPVFGAREVYGSEHVTMARALADGIRGRGVTTRFVPSLDHISTALETDARPGDLFLIVGAGNIDRVSHGFSRRLQRHHAA